MIQRLNSYKTHEKEHYDEECKLDAEIDKLERKK